MGAFVKWWILFILMVCAAIITYNLGGFHLVWEGDITKISFVVLVFLTVGTIRLGYLTYRFTYFQETVKDRRGIPPINIKKEEGWFTSSICSRIGLLGTILGFTMVIASLANFNPDQPEVAIRALSSGLGVALYTTLVGQLANILLSIQSFNLTQAIQLYLEQKPSKKASPK